MNRATLAADWLLTAFATAAAVLRQAMRPVNWRRPVRAEFWRFMDFICVRNLAAVLVAAALVGLLLVSQALYWVERFGQTDAIGQVIIFVMVREIGPLVVGLLVLGTSGTVLIGELRTMRVNGQFQALDCLGVDPFLLLVMPRVVALIAAIFTHSMLFICVAILSGYAMVLTAGATAKPPAQFLASVMVEIGSTGYLILPAKAFAIGLTIGVVCSLTAIGRGADALVHETLTATGFIRAISGILLVSALLSLAL